MINLCRKTFGKISGLVKNNRGASIVEVILILVILIGIVLIFKTEITDLVTKAFTSISNDSNGIFSKL